MQKIKPFNPSEAEAVAALANGDAKAWTVTLDCGRRLLVWAQSQRHAATEAANTSDCGRIVGIRQNFHAQNMSPRPADWRQFIAQGGES